MNPTEIKEKEFKQKIRVKLGQSGLVELTDYTLEEAYSEVVEVKKDDKKEVNKDDNKDVNKDDKNEKKEEKKEPEIKVKYRTKTMKYQASMLNTTKPEIVN